MKLSKDAFFCLSDKEVEELKGKQVTVQMQEPRELIKGTVTGLLYMNPIMYETYKHIGQTKYMGIIINNEIQLKFDANIEYILINDVSDVIDRRSFFKKSANTIIPVLAVLTFGGFAFSSCSRNEPENPSQGGGGGSTTCSNCTNSCSDSCRNSCKNTCNAKCTATCGQTCTKLCASSCEGYCTNGCANTCSGATCASACTGCTGCAGTCKNSAFYY